MTSRWTNFWRTVRGRRLICLLLWVSLCAAAVPIPIPVSLTKDQSEPFPCQSRPCGCRTASQCRQHCCCFNREQKIAWAKKNHVAVENVVDGESSLADKLIVSISQKSTSNTSSSQCGTSHCSQNAAASSKCCSSTSKSSPQATKSASHDATSDSPEYVIGWFAERCQGGTADWNSLPNSLPAEPFFAWSPSFLSVLSRPLTSESQQARTEAPPVPPPRHLA